MSTEVKVPVLPESVADATIATWHKKPGDSIRRDENLVDLETDKVVLEVPAPADGKIVELKADEGDTVHSDDLIAVIEPGEVDAGADSNDDKQDAEDESPSEDGNQPPAETSSEDGREADGEARLSPS